MTAFNQLVQQQTDFNLLHAAELPTLQGDQLEHLAAAAMRISEHIHGAIDDADWYHSLKTAIDHNIAELNTSLKVSPRPFSLQTGSSDPSGV